MQTPFLDSSLVYERLGPSYSSRQEDLQDRRRGHLVGMVDGAVGLVVRDTRGSEEEEVPRRGPGRAVGSQLVPRGGGRVGAVHAPAESYRGVVQLARGWDIVALQELAGVDVERDARIARLLAPLRRERRRAHRVEAPPRRIHRDAE